MPRRFEQHEVMPFALEENNVYNQWRRDVVVEYVATTGRAFPSIRTEIGQALRYALVRMSYREWPPNPLQAVSELVERGLLA